MKGALKIKEIKEKNPKDALARQLKRLRTDFGEDIYATVVVNHKGAKILNIWSIDALEGSGEESDVPNLSTKNIKEKNLFKRLDYLG